MKAYVKPELYYENFELSQHIAACAWDMKNATVAENCMAIGDEEFGNGGLILFAAGPDCNVTDFEAYCYEPSAEAFGIFNS